MKQKLRTLTRALYILLDDCQWKMTHITIENTYRIIAIFEPKRKRHLKCSCCGIQAKHQHLGVREHRALHQILLGGVRRYVCVRQPLIHCSYCDSQSVCYPKWLKAGKRYTEVFRMLVSWLCRYMSCVAVSRRYGIDAKTVRAIDNELLQETTRTVDLSQTRKLLVDEKRIAKRRFATIVLDGDSHKLLYLAEGRRSETLARFLRSLPEEVKQQIEAVAMDGSYAYRRAVEKELPKAKVCLDRFHLYRDVNHMMQQAFHEISQSKAGRAQRQVIRRIATLTSRDDQKSQALLEELASTHQFNAELIALVQLFKDAWKQSSFHQAATHLQGFAPVATRSGIRAIRNFARRISREADYIAHAISLKLTNAAIESFNRKIADFTTRLWLSRLEIP